MWTLTLPFINISDKNWKILIHFIPDHKHNGSHDMKKPTK